MSTGKGMKNDLSISKSQVRGAKPQSRNSGACSACRRRKIRCDGLDQCRNCMLAELACVYEVRDPSARSRRSIVHGGIIDSCRTGEHNQKTAQVSITVQTQLNSQSFPISFFWDLVDDYCTYTLPMLPVIGKEQFESAIRSMYDSTENTSLVYALAAQTINIAHSRSTKWEATPDDSRTLFELALQIRGSFMLLEQITVPSVMVSVCVSIGMFARDRDIAMGAFYNMEAVAGVRALRIDQPEHQATFSPELAAQRERLYWLLFLHDRFHALGTHRMSYFSPLPNVPVPSPDLPPAINAWFDKIIHLFKIIDDNFLKFHMRADTELITSEWIQQKQSMLSDNYEIWSEESPELGDMQQVDITVTRCWLRTLVWRIGLHKFALTSKPESDELNFMSLEYPIRLSHQLRSILINKPLEAVEVHGTGFVHKIFEIACTVADLLHHVVPRISDPETRSADLECFLFLYDFLFKMPRFYSVERTVLAAKLKDMYSVFPNLAVRETLSPMVE